MTQKIEVRMTDIAAHGLIRKADHTGFTVKSLDDSLSFWVDILGFNHLYTNNYEASEFLDNVVGVKGASMTLAMVEAPCGHLIELLEYHAPQDTEDYSPRSCDVGSVHLAFYVTNLEQLLQKIETVGWLRLGTIQTVQDGVRRGLSLAYARSSDGITLEFLQLPDTPEVA